MRFIAYDTETGGLDTSCSLLSAYFIVFDFNFKSIGELDLKIKPNNGCFTVNAEALRVNNINLVEHSKQAVTIDNAKKLLLDFLIKSSNEGQIKLMPVGHNESFDRQFVNTHLVERSTWNKYVSYHSLDTVHIANFLKLCGFIPSSQKISLGNLTELYGIKVKQLHSAKDDTVACVKVLKKMMSTFKNIKSNKEFL
jgi:DNA polymerase III alpha subunit (gram-positive type)